MVRKDKRQEEKVSLASGGLIQTWLLRVEITDLSGCVVNTRPPKSSLEGQGS